MEVRKKMGPQMTVGIVEGGDVKPNRHNNMGSVLNFFAQCKKYESTTPEKKTEEKDFNSVDEAKGQKG